MARARRMLLSRFWDRLLVGLSWFFFDWPFQIKFFLSMAIKNINLVISFRKTVPVRRPVSTFCTKISYLFFNMLWDFLQPTFHLSLLVDAFNVIETNIILLFIDQSCFIFLYFIHGWFNREVEELRTELRNCGQATSSSVSLADELLGEV